MIARRLSVAMLAMLAVLCALAGLWLTSGSALAAFKTTYLRHASFVPATFDPMGNAYVADGSALEKFNSTEEPSEFADAGLAPYISGTSLTGTPEGSFGSVAGAAVAANGDIYVADNGKRAIDVFESSGIFLESWTGANIPGGPFVEVSQIQVNRTTGDMYIFDLSKNVLDAFDASGKYLFQISGASTPQGHFLKQVGGVYFSVAVDDVTGDILIGASNFTGSEPLIYEFDSAGKYLTAFDGLNTPAKSFVKVGLAVNDATGDILVADPPSASRGGRGHGVVDVFNSSFQYVPPQITEMGVPGPTAYEPEMVEMNQATGEIYVISQFAIDVFSSVVLPDAIAGEPTISPPTSATLNGSVDPNGVKVTGCRFEYGTETSYGQEVSCSQAQVGEGKAEVPVSAEVSGLQPDTLYHFRLDATDENGTNMGQDSTFFTSTAPVIEAESSSDIGSASASVGARINAAGLLTTYRVEYGPTAAYGSSTPAANLGNAESAAGVLAPLNGLQPGSEYHFRFVATNAFGTTFGGDTTFKTFAASGVSRSGLPDDRVFELVSSQNASDTDVYVPETNYNERNDGMVHEEYPVQASLDGNGVVYMADPTPGGSGNGGEGQGDQYLATRAPSGGWGSSVLTPPGDVTGAGVYQGFSDDLSVGLINSSPRVPLTADAPSTCTGSYAHTFSDGLYRALFTKTNVSNEHCGEPLFGGISPDGSHIGFSVTAALTPGAPAGGVANLYEWSNGALSLINVLPEGKPDGNAHFGARYPQSSGSLEGSFLTERAVSDDGSRVFWTDLNNNNLYVRENVGGAQEKTVQVDASVGGGGVYQTASTDGSVVFFTKGESLYAFDVNTEQTSTIASGGEVQSMVGASEDGSYVYFVANGSLATGAVEGQPNLYLYHAGTTRFVATLFGGDFNDWGTGEWGGTPEYDPLHTAEVTLDGHSLVFMSSKSLTEYNNAGNNEVYVYDADSAKIACASCSPNGAPPSAGGAYLSLPTGVTRLPRWISDDGSRVFFDTAEPLVAQDTNGKVDVYEWEREGTGSCQQSGGCIYLLTGGTSSKASFFLDASASGNDVFFTSLAQLVPGDQNDNVDLYDARVNGYRPLSPPACTGTGCQGLPAAVPIFATPSSVTFGGVGNFEPSSPTKPAGKAKTKTSKCRKGFVKKHGKCVKRKAKRASKSSKKGRKA